MQSNRLRNGRWNKTANGKKTGGRRIRAPRGVSDIIGTILILGITVALFSTIFFFVSSLPGPTPQSTSQFVAVLGTSAGGTEAYVNITYKNGPTLTTSEGVSVYINSVLHPQTFTACSPPESNPYSLTAGLGSGSWSAGQIWTLHLVPGTTTCPTYSLAATGDNLTISIVETSTNLLLFRVTLPGSNSAAPPIFITEGTNPTPPVLNNNFNITAVIQDRYSTALQVTANLQSIGLGAWVPLTLSPQGYWSTAFESVGPPTVQAGTAYSVSITANDTTTHLSNSAVIQLIFSATITSQAQAVLTLTLALSDETPRVHQGVTVLGTVHNIGTGQTTSAISVTIRASFASGGSALILPATGVTSLSAGTSDTIQTNWVATANFNPTVFKPGSVTFEGWVNCTTANPPSQEGLLNVTVFPRTLLVDETGVTPGLNGSQDTFTWLSTDFASAGIPYNTTIDEPGSGTVTYAGTGPNALDMYDVVLWVDSGQGDMTLAEAGYLVSLIQGGSALWLLGENALNATGGSGCASAVPAGLATLAGDLGVTTTLTAHCNALKSSSSTATLLVSNTGPVASTYVDNTNLLLSGVLNGYVAHPTYYTLGIPTSGGAGTPYITTSGAALSVSYAGTSGGGKSMVSSFELSDISQSLGGSIVTSTSQQAAIVYNVFNWLAGFSSLTPIRDSDDWGVSQVIVEPSQLQFNTPATVYYTIRDNGPDSNSFGATLEVDNTPAYYQGSVITTTVDPTHLGGEINGSFTWVPSFLGYVTVGICISPATSDSDPSNNCMGNSFFSQQIYVHYSVLLVDATDPATTGNSNDTYLIYNDLTAVGFPASTITESYTNSLVSGVHTTTGCGTLPTNIINNLIGTSTSGGGRPQYNLVVWNAGNTNATALQSGNCALSPYNAGLLETFLSLGGTSSSLLYIGDGLLQESTSSATQPTPAETFASSYLGFKDTIAPTKIAGATVKSIYGGVSDPVGDGLSLPYPSAPNGNYSFSTLAPSSGLTVRASFNFTSTDFWTPSSSASYAATDAFAPILGWHTAYWAFNVPAVQSVRARGGNASGTATLELALLRVSTFFGRTLAAPDVVVGAPDITFSTTTSSWINFDSMHPQLEQQYLITANVTNLGGLQAYGVVVDVLDGDHILGSSTVTVGPASSSPSGLVTPGTAEVAVSWTPLYGASNPINVTLVSGTSGDTLAGVGSWGTANVTVYFFYDNGANNKNDWTHNDLVTWDGDDNENLAPPVGQTIFYQDDSNIPDGYDNGELYGAGTLGTYAWGLDSDTCYENLWVCQSDTIIDPSDTTHGSGAGKTYQGNITWVESSPITLEGGESSASASWWQAYALAPYETGGIVCVAPAGTTCHATGYQPVNQSSTTAAGQVTPIPGYTGTLDYDYKSGTGCQQVLSAFTGANTGLITGTDDPTGYAPTSWQYESVNLTQWIPTTVGTTTTVTVYFGLVAGFESKCGGTAIASNGAWWIDQFSASVSGGPSTPTFETYNEESSGAKCSESSDSCNSCGATFGSFIPDDTWNLGTKGTVDAYGISGLPTGTSGAWIDAANYSGQMTLNPNMWDSLYSRSIDLSNAANATLTFNYVWSRVTPNMDPPQGFVVEASPLLANGQTDWVQIWNANQVGVDTQNYYKTWQYADVSLNGYVGEVIELRFLVGTNCGGDGDDDALINYPTQDTVTAYFGSGNTTCNVGTGTSCDPEGAGSSGAIISGVYVQGATTLSSTSNLGGAPSFSTVRSPVIQFSSLPGTPQSYARAGPASAQPAVAPVITAVDLATLVSNAEHTANTISPGPAFAARWS